MNTLHPAEPAREAARLLVCDPIEDSEWDHRVRRCTNTSFYHSSAWARVLHDTYGYRPHYFAIATANRTLAALPIMEVTSPWTGARGVSLPFTDNCEPCGDDPSAFLRLLRHAQALARDRRWRYLECRGTGNLISARPSVRYFGHVVPLSTDEDQVFHRFDSAVRRAIRKAERSGLGVEVTQNIKAIREFYGLFCLTRRRHGLPPQPFSFYEAIHRHVLRLGLGSIVLVRVGAVPVAGALFLHGPGVVMMKFAASDRRFQHLRINNLALWAAMKHYGRAGYTKLDFGRTSIGNEGLRRFKARWGAAEHEIDYHRYDVRRGTFVQSGEPRGGSPVQLFHHLPIALSQLAGRLLYRHMA